jgi:hypothetical protein
VKSTEPFIASTIVVLAIAIAAMLSACATPDSVQASPEDIWTWQVRQNYEQFAHCLVDGLNSAPVQSWFYQASRPITSFEQLWRQDRIILTSIDPAGVEQVRIELVGLGVHVTYVIANAKNLELLGGGAPMVYVRAYVDACASAQASPSPATWGDADREARRGMSDEKDRSRRVWYAAGGSDLRRRA